MSKKTKNLKLIGAWFVKSTCASDWPKEIAELINEAREEISPKLNEKQFNLYTEAECAEAQPVEAPIPILRPHDDG